MAPPGSIRKSESDEVSIISLVSRACISASCHPIEYAKILIQLGHEPIAPKPTRTLFGRPALALPNIVQYLGHIRKRDGFFGLYRGLAPKMCASMAGSFAYQTMTERINELEGDESQKSEEQKEEEKLIRAMKAAVKDILGRSAAVIASQPFHVIAVRSMAQFVGGETAYSSLFGSVQEIYGTDGLSGFYHGLVPRILGEVSTVAITHTLVFIVNNYLVHDPLLKSYTSAVIALVANSITYPFHVVSNCMAVTGSRLAAGSPPHMPIYISWTDCWSQLKCNGQLKRGSSVLWRYYTPPKHSVPMFTPLDGTGPPINLKYQ